MEHDLRLGDARKPPYNIRVHLAYCDPPTNRGKNEGNSSDRLSYDEYREFAYWWLTKTISLLKDNAWLVLTLPTSRPTNFNIRYLYETIIHTQTTLVLEQPCIWDYGFGLYTHKRFVPSHDDVLIYKQGRPTFYQKHVRIESQRLRDGDPRANPLGRTPSDVWSIPRTPGNSKEREFLRGNDRTCQPTQLCKRVLLAYTRQGDSVYEPFAGSGSMAVVARAHQRNYYGLEICSEYIHDIKRRLNESWQNLL